MTDQRQGCVVLLSGGMDSSTLLHKAVEEFGKNNVAAISFNYGQRHSRELFFAEWQAQEAGIMDHVVVDLQSANMLLQGSALTDPDVEVPEGHYADESMKLTVVPNRNMIMASLAAGWAISLGLTHIGMAVHAGDHAIYPDCRPAFIDAMRHVLGIANYQPIILWAPFLHMDKGQIAQEGRRLDIDYEMTWTCYKGGAEPCGKCGSCVERAEALTWTP